MQGQRETKTDIVEIGADGSERRFFRLTSEGLIAIHPAKGPMGPPEQEAYFLIGRHLEEKGVPVPKIHGFHKDSGVILVEDLGDASLYSIMHSHPRPSEDTILDLYEKAIKGLLALNVKGREGFDPSYCHDTPYYDSYFVAKREALYFTRFFLFRFKGLDRDPELEEELIEYSKTVDEFDGGFLIHRDFQSRNLFVKDDKVFIIDFQGAMIGPLFYDLAALLNDPYVELGQKTRDVLFEKYLQGHEAMGVSIKMDAARRQYLVLSFFRLLQVLGAFSFLTLQRRRPFFKDFIPKALERLKALMLEEEFLGLKRLRRTLGTL